MLELQTITSERLPNIHSDEVLKEEFLSPMNVSAYRLAKEIHVPETRFLRSSHFSHTSSFSWNIRRLGGIIF